MKTKDVLVIGGLALIAYLLWKKSALGGGAGALGGSGGCGCGGAGSSALNPYTGGIIPGCPSASPGNGNYTQGTGPLPPQSATDYQQGTSQGWDAPGFHLAFDLSF